MCLRRVFNAFGGCSHVPLTDQVGVTANLTPLSSDSGEVINILSPNFGIEDSNYPNDIFCQYAPVCQPGNSLMDISWLQEEFQLQEAKEISGIDLSVCVDFVEFSNLILDLSSLQDDFGRVCGNQEFFFDGYSGTPFKVNFQVLAVLLHVEIEVTIQIRTL